MAIRVLPYVSIEVDDRLRRRVDTAVAKVSDRIDPAARQDPELDSRLEAS
jgi:hypothetical protein